MDTDIITVKQCLEIMERGQIFSCEGVTYDKSRNSGGDVLVLEEAKLLQNEDEPTIKATVRSLTQHEINLEEARKIKVAPNHSEHYTRNVRKYVCGMPTSKIIKLHPPLLTVFNGKTVVP